MFIIGKATDPGIRRREKPNEDSLGIYEPQANDTRPLLAVIADGMGGYVGGSAASQLVVDHILDTYREMTLPKNLLDALKNLINGSHLAVMNESRKKPEYDRMGTTVVVAAIQNDHLFIANLGDSRAYVIDAASILQVSYDHSLVADEVRAGLITPADALIHPRRNVLTQSLTARRPNITPYLNSVPFLPGSSVLLCSDGLWGTVGEAQIMAAVNDLPPQDAAARLVELANSNQGPDNISVIIITRK